MFDVVENSDNPVTMECEPERFDHTVKKLKEMGADFLTLSSTRSVSGEICLDYYFRHDKSMVVVRVRLTEKTISSLYSIFPKSDFIEREINNLFGVKFLGHPNLERIPTGEDENE